jgi:hypothetical protein
MRRFGVIMTFRTLFQPRYSGKGSIIAKGVAIQAFLELCFTLYSIHLFRVEMNDMTKIERLILAGIEDNGKNDPANKQSRYKTGKEIDQSAPYRIGNQFGIIGEYNTSKRRDPTTSGRFFRGIRLIFHGPNPFSKRLCL